MELLNKNNIQAFISSFDNILCDCDGVIWKGVSVVNGAPESIAALTNMGKRIFYVSNNSTKSIEDYIEKLTSMGFHADECSVYSSAVVTARYMQKHFPHIKKVYVIGQDGLKKELKRINDIEIIYTDPSINLTVDSRSYDPDVGLVVVGYDGGFNYEKLTTAMGYLSRNNCKLLVSNSDTSFPIEGEFLPGTGSIVASVIAASNQQPVAICGKPSLDLVELVKTEIGVNYDPKRVLMIGDRLNTDIKMSNLAGFSQSLLVLTGCDHDLKDVETQYKEDKLLTPKYYINSIADLKGLINSL